MFELDTELFDQYRCDSRKNIETLVADLLRAEKGGAGNDDELLEHAFRAVHAVKESSQSLDLVKVAELAHKLEDVLSVVRSSKMALTADRISALLCAADRLSELALDSDCSNEADIADLLAELDRLYVDRQAPFRGGAKPGGSSTDGGGGHLRMLVVEDDFACRFLLQKFLSRFGECHIAVNGTEAVEAFRLALDQGYRYDLICMDIMMPEIDGREALKQIRAIEEQRGVTACQGTKIFMTTTVNELKEVANCFGELCDDYLIKPINLTQLKNRMEQFQLL